MISTTEMLQTESSITYGVLNESFFRRSEDARFRLAVEVRDSVLEAMLVVSLAQALLPGVQFPYCTPRELSIVSQVSVQITIIRIDLYDSYILQIF